MIHRLHRRMAHLLAFAPSRRRLGIGLLAIMLPEALRHIALNVSHMFQNIIDNPLFEGPAEEIELTHSRLFDRGLTANLKTDALTAAEGIKQPFRIGLELSFIMKVHHELTVLQQVTDVEFLGIVRDEPVNQTEADG